ncbi:hypothetical protein [Brevibacillus laterosporus]|nr:hypothetical protein [Brevibacillus laterosporus]
MTIVQLYATSACTFGIVTYLRKSVTAFARELAKRHTQRVPATVSIVSA